MNEVMQMKSSTNENTGLLLVIAIYAAAIWYRNNQRTLVAGMTYLAAAGCIVFLYALLSFILHIELKKGKYVQRIWLLQTRAQLVLYVGCQLQIIALLNMWASLGPSTISVCAGSYFLAVCFIIVSDRMIALAELPTQDGGSKPLDYFGRPRSRRLLFWGFVAYPETALALGGIWVFLGVKKYSAFNNPPQLCLLLVALASAGTAVMVFQRYRKSVANKQASTIVILASFLCLGMAALVQLVLTYSYYVYGLSAFSIICIAISANWLLRASENGSAVQESAPE